MKKMFFFLVFFAACGADEASMLCEPDGQWEIAYVLGDGTCSPAEDGPLLDLYEITVLTENSAVVVGEKEFASSAFDEGDCSFAFAKQSTDLDDDLNLVQSGAVEELYVDGDHIESVVTLAITVFDAQGAITGSCSQTLYGSGSRVGAP